MLLLKNFSFTTFSFIVISVAETYLPTYLVEYVMYYQCLFVVVIKLNITTSPICPFMYYVSFKCDY